MMIAQINQFLCTALRSILPDTYAEDVPSKLAFPYIVFDTGPLTGDGEFTQSLVIDVDIWDKPENGDTATVEELADAVQAALDKSVYEGRERAVILYLESRLSVKDEDKRIKRRRLTFEARILGRS